MCILRFLFFFFKQKTAYGLRMSDWSSDGCSSDLARDGGGGAVGLEQRHQRLADLQFGDRGGDVDIGVGAERLRRRFDRSEEHTSELQSLMRISYAVFCLKKKKKNKQNEHRPIINHVTVTVILIAIQMQNIREMTSQADESKTPEYV